MADNLLDGSEAIDFQEDSSTEDEKYNGFQPVDKGN